MSSMIATRDAYGETLVELGAENSDIVALDADLSGSTNPYEAWKYTRGRLRKFVFYDETGLGNYALIWSNETTEPGRANWRDLLGAEGVQDVERF